MLPIHECFYSMGTQNNSWKDKKNNFIFVPADVAKIESQVQEYLANKEVLQEMFQSNNMILMG